jgi:hypothetical protein
MISTGPNSAAASTAHQASDRTGARRAVLGSWRHAVRPITRSQPRYALVEANPS